MLHITRDNLVSLVRQPGRLYSTDIERNEQLGRFDIHVWFVPQSQTWKPKILECLFHSSAKNTFSESSTWNKRFILSFSFFFFFKSRSVHYFIGKWKKEMLEEFPVNKEKTAANKCSQIRNFIGYKLHLPPLITNPVNWRPGASKTWGFLSCSPSCDWKGYISGSTLEPRQNSAKAKQCDAMKQRK